MKNIFTVLVAVLLFQGVTLANTILVEENNFPVRNHFGYYGIYQASFYTRGYDASGAVVDNSGGYDSQLNQEFYFGLFDDQVLRVVAPYYLTPGAGTNNQIATNSGLFNFGVKYQYLVFKEKDERPSFSFIASAKSPSQNYQTGQGVGYSQVGVMGVLEKQEGALTTHFNLGFVYTSPYNDSSSGTLLTVDPGDQLQVNLAAEYPINRKFNLSYELLAEYAGADVVNGTQAGGSEKTIISNLIGVTCLIDGNSYCFGGLQVPVYVKQNNGLSAVIPLMGIYLEF
ncbi:MAG: transporter [Candidatus Margulisbacteria bacterium]|nr:transporter [Candidatus Margulisiibacteriota bacterium]